MKVVSADAMRALDRRAIEEGGLSAGRLMERAGEGVAAAVEQLAMYHQLEEPSVILVAGGGNNGGDVLVAARYLWEREVLVACRLVRDPARLRGAAGKAYRAAVKAGVPMEVCLEAGDWTGVPAADILVDGLLGTGGGCAPGDVLRGVMGPAVEWVNRCAEEMLVLAVDMPSGMRVRADVTVALGLPKVETLAAEMADMTGRLEVVDIGLPDAFVEEAEGEEVELITAQDVASLFARRRRDAHKGDFGHLQCVGGAPGMSGAIALAARAGLRSGAGWVSVAVPETLIGVVAPQVPEAMVQGEVSARQANAWVVGPGLGRSEERAREVLNYLKEPGGPLVLDADGLAVLADALPAIEEAPREVLLTPHPGEFARLFGVSVEELQADRVALAKMAAVRLGAVCVLKGARTVVADSDGRTMVNATGNPGMASGGMGDVLAGVVGGLLAQGLSAFEAACAAVWLHGHAGDLAAAGGAEISLCAGDVVGQLPEAFRAVSPR